VPESVESADVPGDESPEPVVSTNEPESEDVVPTGTDGTTVVTASDDQEATVPPAER
jgi:hypothetical protein